MRRRNYPIGLRQADDLLYLFDKKKVLVEFFTYEGLPKTVGFDRPPSLWKLQIKRGELLFTDPKTKSRVRLRAFLKSSLIQTEGQRAVLIVSDYSGYQSASIELPDTNEVMEILDEIIGDG